MPNLQQYRQEMYHRLPRALGQVEIVTSFTSSTIVCSSLATGESAQKFTDWYLLRPNTTSTADRLRRCSAFAGSTGTLTQSGAGYSDTTATGEFVEITRYEPWMYDNAIQDALQALKRMDRSILPSYAGDHYYLNNFSWDIQAGQIKRVAWTDSPILTNNRVFNKWNSVDSIGLIEPPDFWTLTGSGASVARSSLHTPGVYSAAIARSGADALLSQTSGILWDGVNNDSLQGQQVCAAAWAWASSASQVRLQITDGVTTSSSSYHSGGSTLEELTVTHTVGDSAQTLTVQISVEVDGTVYVPECYMSRGAAVTDGMRRNTFREVELRGWTWEPGPGPLCLILPLNGSGGQYVVYSERPYPTFDPIRIGAGTADNDSSDAPLIPVATGAISFLYRALASQEDSNSAKYAVQAEIWRQKFETVAAAHKLDPNANRESGISIGRQMFGRPPVRF